MRPYIIALLALGASPLAAQAPSIAPAPSALFRVVPGPKTDLGPALTRADDTGMTWYQGALLGAGIGGLGMVMAAKAFHWDQESELPAIAFLPLGAIIGFVVGGSQAQGH